MNASTNHYVPAGPPSLVRERGVEASEIDPWRLAGLLVPGLGPGERGKLARAFGITLAPSEAVDPIVRAQESTVIVASCRKHLEGLDLPLLQRLARIFSGSLLPEAGLIDDVFRARARLAFADDGPASAAADVSDLPVSGSPLPPPLQAARTRRGVESREVYEAFAGDGPLARSLPGYEARDGQLKMSRAVAKALNDRLKLIVEAGTGTGKSLAYLLPAATYAAKNGRRVVVSTNTINLQEQLYFKDIPLLRRAMATPFEATVLKGRANYLCLRRWRSFLREGVQNDSDRLLAAKVLLWLTRTETGDRGELALDARESTRWATALAADAQHCTPQLCRDNRVGRCFLSRARRRAEGSHVIVVNHALLLADQALESKILPEYDDLIVDEAHHLEDVATRQLGANIDQQELLTALTMLSQQQGAGRYAGLVSRVQATLIAAAGAPMRNEAGALTQPAHDAAEAARQSVAAFFEAVTAFVADAASAPGQSRGYGAERGAMAERDLRLTPEVRSSGAWPAVELAWDEAARDLSTLTSGLAHIADALEPFEGSAEAVDDALADLATAQRQLGEVLINLSAIVAAPTPDQVYWITGHERGLTLHAAPLNVGELLEKHLFSQKDCVVLTTATAQVGGSFRYLRERLGLGPGSFTLAVPSPFDYASQALLCVASDLPDPGDRAFGDASHKALQSILEVTGGRTLVLFTSHAALRAAHEYLRPRLRRLTVLGQGLDGGRQQLLERLREAPRTVLLGTSSFWEGIDVVGDALSCLVIVKLPFSVPNDPVFAARSEQFTQPFGEFALPQAVLRLKQGFGRLIRSTRDRGVVVVLDSRLRSKSYGSIFLRSLPPATQRHCSWRELAPLTQSWLAGTAPSIPGRPAAPTRTPGQGI